MFCVRIVNALFMQNVQIFLLPNVKYIFEKLEFF